MKRKDITALHEMTTDELQQKLAELRKDLAKAKLELPVGKLADTRMPGKIRDDIARIKTVLREKQLAAKNEEPAAEKKEEKETK